ncbi:MAG TPA: hypothetical protein DCY07_06780 [Rhodospirillaceae bacterium]|nr:hypothetical protein [Rhodospirillaceae bacterium]
MTTTKQKLMVLKIAAATTTFAAAAAVIVNPTSTSILAVFGGLFAFGACLAAETFLPSEDTSRTALPKTIAALHIPSQG